MSSLTHNVKINQTKSSRLSKPSVASFHLMWLSVKLLDSRPRGRGFEPHRRHCVVSMSKNINPSLVLVQPRKTRPFITERLLNGGRELNKQTFHLIFSCADPEGGGLNLSPGKSQVVWVSRKNSIWTPPPPHPPAKSLTPGNVGPLWILGKG